MKTPRSDDDLRLRELLNRGDPARHADALGPQDLAHMRQSMLRAAAERRTALRPVGWRWAAAGACVLVLSVVVLNLRYLSPDRSASPEPASSRAYAAPPQQLAREIAAPPAVEAEPATADSASVKVGEDEEAPPPVVVASSDDVAASREKNGENLQARTLRFTTRRGTQIIWILDPELEL